MLGDHQILIYEIGCITMFIAYFVHLKIFTNSLFSFCLRLTRVYHEFLSTDISCFVHIIVFALLTFLVVVNIMDRDQIRRIRNQLAEQVCCSWK